MKIAKGMVVRSIAGHDKGCIYIVLSYDSTSVTICDGKRKKVVSPKKKNIKHIELINYIFDETIFKSDRSIRKALSQYRCSNRD